ncbi:hypothetical protein [Haloarcula nitratireducens]|uniref:Uncharacterized protein n=1 Tax=Haloarcula nitratireducens TaxID=2487749 RepID=A0AAW4PDD9_9EURY|nr:hypothetical protein [Halomicroarcula nitratireducens]MBX0295934.1 hypothetical protein [Halomicroarcula nitratireducens]
MSRRSRSDSDHVETRRRVLALAGTGIAASLAGCDGGSETATPTPTREEVSVTLTLENRDDVARSYEVVVNQGSSVTDSFSGTLPAGESVKMVATLRRSDEQYDFSIDSDGGQRGRTWDPAECADFVVDATIENGEPAFDVRCRTESESSSASPA